MLIAQFYPNPELDFIVAEFSPLKKNHILYILSLGILSLFGQIYLTKAFSHKETGIIGAMGYSNVVFSIILGVLIGDPMPDFSALAGIILIIISGIIVSVLK
jgi:drug/metabolite transporter (DMT)-like permease